MASVAEGESSVAGAGESTAAGGNADGLRGNSKIPLLTPSRRLRLHLCRCLSCDFERNARFMANSQRSLTNKFYDRLFDKRPSQAGIEGAETMLSWKEIQEVLTAHSREVHRLLRRRRREDLVRDDGQPGLFSPCCSRWH